MAKYDDDISSKPSKSTSRRFPWRLWLFAIAMTGAAVAGGNYAWRFRQKAAVASDDADSCRVNLTKMQAQTADATKKKDDCMSLVADSVKKTKDLEARLGIAPSPAPAVATAPAAPAPTIAPATIAAPPVAAPTMVTSAPREDASARWLPTIEEIQRQLSRMGESGQLKLTARRGSFVMTLPADTLFTAGTADLAKPGELAVLEVGFTLKRYPDRRFLVVGHTDDAPFKSATYKDNGELSIARAQTVTRFLVQAGVDPKSLIPGGAGENDPLAKDRAKNRRIEITLLPGVGELPPLPVSLGSDTGPKPELKVEAPLKPDAPKPAARP